MPNGHTLETGISMTIDETRLVPNLMSDYLDMSPGNAYDVQLSVTESKRIKWPYTSKCLNDHPPMCKISGAYSMGRCSQGCLYQLFKASCNCTEPTSIEGDLEEDFKAKVLCQNEHVDCVFSNFGNLDRKVREERLVKPCTPECYRVKYSVM